LFVCLFVLFFCSIFPFFSFFFYFFSRAIRYLQSSNWGGQRDFVGDDVAVRVVYVDQETCRWYSEGHVER